MILNAEMLGRLGNGARSGLEAIAAQSAPPASTPAPAAPPSNKPKTERELMDEIILKAFGADATDYQGVFRKGYALEAQDQSPDLDNWVKGNTATNVHNLGRAYIQKYKEAFGQMPNDQEVKDFVGTTLTPTVASKFITGNFTEGQQRALAGEYVQENPSASAAANQKNALMGEVAKYLEDYLRGETEAGTRDINDQFDTQKGRMAEQAAGLGRLYQPNFLSGNLGRLEQDRARSLSDLIKGIRTKGAELGFGASQAESQFARNYGLQKKQLALGMEDRERGILDNIREERLAAEVGRRQADAMKPGTLDYLNTAFSGLGAIGGLMKGFGAMKGANATKGG